MQLTNFRLHVQGETPEFNVTILTDVQPTASVAETHRLVQNYVITLTKHEHQKAITHSEYCPDSNISININ